MKSICMDGIHTKHNYVSTLYDIKQFNTNKPDKINALLLDHSISKICIKQYNNNNMQYDNL